VNATYTERRGNELYIYVRGVLVMKRYLNTGMSVTFHVAPTGVHWSNSQASGRENPDNPV
jgi:hypothetical protein